MEYVMLQQTIFSFQEFIYTWKQSQDAFLLNLNRKRSPDSFICFAFPACIAMQVFLSLIFLPILL